MLSWVAVTTADGSGETRPAKHAVDRVERVEIDSTVVVGSKLFTESVILGELVAQLATDLGYGAERRFELGGTRFVWSALINGDIDVYAEYSGTLSQEIFSASLTDQEISDSLARLGIRQTGALGFNNTYALGVKRTLAQKYSLRTISDLVNYPTLRLAFSNEFLDRTDGWPGLQSAYGLPQEATGLDHSLAYRGLESESIDVVDLYSTDAEIDYYDLVVLEDDRQYFPGYEALYLYRSDLVNSAPQMVLALEQLTGSLSEAKMIAMNAAVKIGGRSEEQVASEFLNPESKSSLKSDTIAQRVTKRTIEHLELVLISLGLAILIAVPLGIAAAKISWLSAPVLGFVAVLYTIPSLALLVFMIPLLGIGAIPAIAALFLYSLLPMVRNTYEGLVGISGDLQETAESLGLGWFSKLTRIELPLASRSILAGVKTAAVINIGTATLGALIGAGGYGQPILTGIRLDDTALILEGAVPAAVLALAAQGMLEAIGQRLIPRGLRQEGARNTPSL
ncbi:MAG: ABC transporter permease subunit [Rhodothermales bacterium]|nr:ABC transporter permease subunit [Rhodothermales bacterium]